MARVNWSSWFRAFRSRALDLIILFVVWFLFAVNLFVVFDAPTQFKLAGWQQVEATDPEIAIISRSQARVTKSQTDQRKGLAKILDQIEGVNPKAVIVLEELDQKIDPVADQELMKSLDRLGKSAILFVNVDTNLPENDISKPLARFHGRARLGHDLQLVAGAVVIGRIWGPIDYGHTSPIRHLAVEAIDPKLSPERTYYSGLYRFWRLFIGLDPNEGLFSSAVDQRIRELKVTRIDEERLSFPNWTDSVDESTIFVIEPIRARQWVLLNTHFTQSELAEQTALQLYSLKRGAPNYVLDEDLAVLILLLCSAILYLRKGFFGFRLALALSAAWMIAAYLLIPYSIYFSIFGPIALFFTFAGVSARSQAEKRGIQMAGKLHPGSNLPNSVAFREAAIGPGQLVLAINSDRFAHSKSKPAQFFERTFGQRLPKSVFQTSDTTLTALTDRATALKLVAKLSPSEWQSKALRAVAFKPRTSMGLDTVVGDLETRFADLRAQGVPFKFVDTNERGLDSQKDEHAAHGQQLFREVLVYDMEAHTPIGALIGVPKADGDFAQIKQLIESRIKKQERQAAEGGPSRGLWLAIDHSLLRDPAAIEYIAEALTQDSMQALMSCVLLRGFSQSHATGLELGSVRRLARSGIEIGSGGLEQDGHSFADLINVPAQVMSIDLSGLDPLEETASMLRAAKLFTDELARELYVENVSDAALAKMVSEAQVKYASGPAIAEFILGSDRANSDARAAV